jgi:hypothetical protein
MILSVVMYTDNVIFFFFTLTVYKIKLFHRLIFDYVLSNFCRCIPYRYKQDIDGNKSNELEVLVVSSQKGQALMFPKV